MGYPWRDPDEETIDIYPGLVVHDGRRSGSITYGRTRLPIECIIHTALREGWDEVEEGWSPSAYFLSDLLEVRGEFARLLLTLANAERVEQEREEAILNAHWAVRSASQPYTEATGETLVNVSPWDPHALQMPSPWWDDPELSKPVLAQLQRCVEALQRPGPEWAAECAEFGCHEQETDQP